MVAKGEGDGGGMAWEFGFSRCKLLHIQIVDKKENNSAGGKRKNMYFKILFYQQISILFPLPQVPTQALPLDHASC